MCRFQTLYHDNNTGYIVQCIDCMRLQMAYGNITVTFYAEEFQSFRELVKSLLGQPHLSEHRKNIHIPTSCESVALLLSPAECGELYNMLEKADDELKAQQIMGLFSR